jgi:hypothetical protein
VLARSVLVVLVSSGCAGDGTTGASTSGSSGEAPTGAVTAEAATTEAATTGAPTTAAPDDLPAARECNGRADLCARRFDEVAFPCTHNAYAARDDGFQAINANQNHGVAAQLADGVRCMMLDVHDSAGETALCHGPCGLGKLDHVEVLLEIAAFMAGHPDEVLTIIYEDDVPAERIVADLEESGLAGLTYAHAGGAWPTLAEMIDANTRLLVTAEQGGPPPAYFHHVWDLASDTPYSFHAQSEFTCDLNRGQADNDLYLVNHWLSTEFDTPSEAGAIEVNVHDVLLPRAMQCRREGGQAVNFLAVDFYEHGDLFAVVDALNDL